MAINLNFNDETYNNGNKPNTTTLKGDLNAIETQVNSNITNISTNTSAIAQNTTHRGLSSGVHGATGSVVGTTDSQTLTNKTIDADNNTISNIAYDELESEYRKGWTLPITGSLSRGGANDPVFAMTISSVDWSDRLQAGMRIKWTQNSTVRYGIITEVSFSTDTSVTIYGGTDYDMESTGTYAISNCYASRDKAPFGFPLNPTKWTVEVNDATQRSQAASASTWYNINSTSMSVPNGGEWLIGAQFVLTSVPTSNTSSVSVQGAISTGTSSTTNERLRQWTELNDGTSNGKRVSSSFTLEDLVETSGIAGSSTSYYLIVQTSDAGTIFLQNALGNLRMYARCAYL
jgi:hypothetical protein